MREMTGVEGGGGAGADAGAVVVVSVVVSVWVSPGMEVDSLFIPRPPPELPPWLDDPGTAIAEIGVKLDEADAAGLEIAAPNDSDAAGAVVTEVVFVGARALDVLGLDTLESLLTLCSVVL